MAPRIDSATVMGLASAIAESSRWSLDTIAGQPRGDTGDRKASSCSALPLQDEAGLSGKAPV